MSKYILLGQFTEATATGLAAKTLPAEGWEWVGDVEGAVRGLLKELGGTLHDVLFTLGQYDVVVTFTVSSEREVAMFALNLARTVGLRTSTLTAIDGADVPKLLSDTGKVNGP